MGLSLEDEVDDSLRDRVGESQVGTGDGDEAEDDGRGLGNLTAVGPLDALQLGPGGPQEVGDPVAARTRARGGARRLGARRRSRGGRRGADRLALELGLVDVGRLAVSTRDDRGLEHVLLAEVVELARDVLPMDLIVRLPFPGLAVACALSVAGHGLGLPGLPVAGVTAAPLAVLAQRDPLGIVALGLVGLVVAALALLAGEGDTDAHVSTGHKDSGSVSSNEAEKRPAGGRSDTPWYYPSRLRQHHADAEHHTGRADEGAQDADRPVDRRRGGVALPARTVGLGGTVDGQRGGGDQADAGRQRHPDHGEDVVPVDDRRGGHAGASAGGTARRRREASQASPATISTATTSGPSAPWPKIRAKA